MKKEVTVKEEAGALVAPSEDVLELNHAGAEMDADDFRIPKLTLIQQMTKAAFNTEGAPVGNFINSLEKIDMGDKFDVFVMSCVKLWRFNYEVKKGKEIKKEYLTIVDFKPYPNMRKDFEAGTALLPPEVIKKLERNDVRLDQLLSPDLIYRFSVLLVDEVKDQIAFPYMIDFTRTSAPAGNKLKNIFFKMYKIAKKKSYEKVFTISSSLVQSEYDYFVIDATSGRNSTEEEVEAAENWLRELSVNSAKVIVEEENADEARTVEAEVIDTNKPKF